MGSDKSHRELKQLGFVRIIAMKVLVWISILYENAKKRSPGPLKSAVEVVDRAVNVVIAPVVYDKFKGMSDHLLAFFDEKVDGVVKRFDMYVPASIKQFVNKSRSMTQKVLEVAQIVVQKARVGGLCVAICYLGTLFFMSIMCLLMRFWSDKLPIDGVIRGVSTVEEYKLVKGIVGVVKDIASTIEEQIPMKNVVSDVRDVVGVGDFVSVKIVARTVKGITGAIRKCIAVEDVTIAIGDVIGGDVASSVERFTLTEKGIGSVVGVARAFREHVSVKVISIAIEGIASAVEERIPMKDVASALRDITITVIGNSISVKDFSSAIRDITDAVEERTRVEDITTFVEKVTGVISEDFARAATGFIPSEQDVDSIVGGVAETLGKYIPVKGIATTIGDNSNAIEELILLKDVASTTVEDDTCAVGDFILVKSVGSIVGDITSVVEERIAVIDVANAVGDLSDAVSGDVGIVGGYTSIEKSVGNIVKGVAGALGKHIPMKCIASVIGDIPNIVEEHIQLQDVVDAVIGDIPSTIEEFMSLKDVDDTIEDVTSDVGDFILVKDVSSAVSDIVGVIEVVTIAVGDVTSTASGDIAGIDERFKLTKNGVGSVVGGVAGALGEHVPMKGVDYAVEKRIPLKDVANTNRDIDSTAVGDVTTAGGDFTLVKDVACAVEDITGAVEESIAIEDITIVRDVVGVIGGDIDGVVGGFIPLKQGTDSVVGVLEEH